MDVTLNRGSPAAMGLNNAEHSEQITASFHLVTGSYLMKGLW
jgi:hypothetical protein